MKDTTMLASVVVPAPNEAERTQTGRDWDYLFY
jgi:hypothetical protein